jgi:hypothetical protein
MSVSAIYQRKPWLYLIEIRPPPIIKPRFSICLKRVLGPPWGLRGLPPPRAPFGFGGLPRPSDPPPNNDPYKMFFVLGPQSMSDCPAGRMAPHAHSPQHVAHTTTHLLAMASKRVVAIQGCGQARPADCLNTSTGVDVYPNRTLLCVCSIENDTEHT